MAHQLNKMLGLSIKKACRLMSISQARYRHIETQAEINQKIADKLTELVTTKGQTTWGFRLCYLHLRKVLGWPHNHKRVYRIYCQLNLNLRIKPRQRIQREKPLKLAVPEAINQVWSVDFMHDQLADGRTIRTFNVLDDHNREGLLNQCLFDSIEHAQIEATQWLWCYNRHRPHMALGGKTPFQIRSLSEIDSRATH
jgi:putative transposase